MGKRGENSSEKEGRKGGNNNNNSKFCSQRNCRVAGGTFVPPAPSTCCRSCSSPGALLSSRFILRGGRGAFRAQLNLTQNPSTHQPTRPPIIVGSPALASSASPFLFPSPPPKSCTTNLNSSSTSLQFLIFPIHFPLHFLFRLRTAMMGPAWE